MCHSDDYMTQFVSAFDISVCLDSLFQRKALVNDRSHSSPFNKTFEESEVFGVFAYSPRRPEDDLLAAPPHAQLPSNDL